jgi:hypothetical protein
MNNITFTDSHFFVGIDTHLKNWRVTIRNSGLELKTFSMNPSPDELNKYLNKRYHNGIYFVVYEAGFCGFWIQRAFTEAAISCIVVHPAEPKYCPHTCQMQFSKPHTHPTIFKRARRLSHFPCSSSPAAIPAPASPIAKGNALQSRLPYNSSLTMRLNYMQRGTKPGRIGQLDSSVSS